MNFIIKYKPQYYEKLAQVIREKAEKKEPIMNMTYYDEPDNRGEYESPFHYDRINYYSNHGEYYNGTF